MWTEYRSWDATTATSAPSEIQKDMWVQADLSRLAHRSGALNLFPNGAPLFVPGHVFKVQDGSSFVMDAALKPGGPQGIVAGRYRIWKADDIPPERTIRELEDRLNREGNHDEREVLKRRIAFQRRRILEPEKTLEPT